MGTYWGRGITFKTNGHIKTIKQKRYEERSRELGVFNKQWPSEKWNTKYLTDLAQTLNRRDAIPNQLLYRGQCTLAELSGLESCILEGWQNTKKDVGWSHHLYKWWVIGSRKERINRCLQSSKGSFITWDDF